MGRFPARIHVLFAREVNYAVIIRRGPSKHVCTIGWNRSDNSFSIGQWLKGRIYERRSDLSPDGKHMIYFAMNGKWDSETGGSWTAISRAPYLKAIGLWGKGDCWHGGGLFESNSRFWINHGYGHKKLFAPKDPDRLQEAREWALKEQYGGECPGVYYLRLQRDKWKLIERKITDKFSSATVFEKRVCFHWKLRKLAISSSRPHRDKGCYYDEHQLCNVDSGQVLEFPDWEWAEVDKRGIYWAEKGRLFAGRLDASGLCEVKEVRDLNDMSFEPIEAPY